MNKVLLCILDGVGIRKEKEGNALKNANTPNIDFLLKKYPNKNIYASGKYVGLPYNQMGNSEVGHLTIGAGRIIYQSLELINNSIKDKSFYSNKSIINAINHAKKYNSKLHIMGMLSDGGVHSHEKHIYALIDMAKKEGIEKVYLHMFTDGRDTLPNVALKYLDKLKIFLLKYKNTHISTISGRFYAMDRDGMWDNVKKYYDVLVNGIGNKEKNYQDLILHSYKKKVFDEFIEPTIIDPEGIVSDNDAVIMANFRPDRIPELFSAITNPKFDKFETKKLNNIKVVTMMPVSDDVICTNAFGHQEVKNSLGEVLANKDLRVLRIAEYSKFPHVTHFIDGDKDVDYLGTDKVKIARHDVATYDLDPAMSSYEVTDYIEKNIKKYDVVIVNFANGDMVGHTGNIEACIKAMEAVDECLGRLEKLANQYKFTMFVTADHGNCDEMIDKEGRILTSHSLNPVNFIISDDNYVLKDGSLKDIAPTMLNYMGIKIPKEMTGDILTDEIL